MIQSLRDIISKAVPSYFESDLGTWMNKWPGQPVLTGRSINWTAEVTDAIEKNKVSDFLDQFNDQIKENVQQVKQGVSKVMMRTLQAMIVLDLHSQTILERLINNNVTVSEDFVWLSNMRYYIVDAPYSTKPNESMAKSVHIKMIHTTVEYGFEYLGNPSRLVMTPLTERCVRTLMCALNLKLGGAPMGPAGSGKTESVKDMAKAVAKQCVVFNCSDGIDFHAMAKFLKGLAQSGAWSCFDEFNRIELDVLSVVAQQIQTIHNAVISGVKTFDFEGAELTLNPTCSV